MKTRIFKSMMPVAVMVFAVAAAFATQAKEVSSSTLVDAYVPMGIGQPCENRGVKCETVQTSKICTINNQQAFGLENPEDETSCNILLFQPEQ